LDRNYATGFEDFRMDALEHFPGVDFSPIKLHIVAKSFLLQTSSEDETLKTTLPLSLQRTTQSMGTLPLVVFKSEKFVIIFIFFSCFSLLLFRGPLFWTISISLSTLSCPCLRMASSYDCLFQA